MTVFRTLASLFCAAANDFLFKLFKRKQSATGAFVTLTGVVCLGIMLSVIPPFCLLPEIHVSEEFQPEFFSFRRIFVRSVR